MNDEKTDKAGVTISVKIPREWAGLPSRPMHVWIAFAIFAVLLIGLGGVLGVKFGNVAKLGMESVSEVSGIDAFGA